LALSYLPLVNRKSTAPVVHRINPLEDPRWDGFLKRHPRSSVFHTSAWLESLRRTYGCQPVAFSTSSSGEDLQNALVACRVDSWLTGQRLVSVPFSDHCDPLFDSAADFAAVVTALEHELRKQNLRYFELRPMHSLEPVTSLFQQSHTYWHHQVDLSPDLSTLFHNCHKSSTQRKIKRAEREGLTCHEGRSEALLDDFYRLLLLTRRRHQLPPQPRTWFQNLLDRMGEALTIRVASKDGRPAAAVLTLQYKDVLVFKYGASDARLHPLGGTQFLFWHCIEDAKRRGLRFFDLGRTDYSAEGLARFKDRWGSIRSTLVYTRFATSPHFGFRADSDGWKESTAKRLVAQLPDWAFCSLGSLFYRHAG